MPNMFVIPKTTEVTLGTYVVRSPGTDPQMRPVNVGKTFTNRPMNIDLVESVAEGEYAIPQVPDVNLYTIIFYFSGGDRRWYFEIEVERNEEYCNLLKVDIGKNGKL